MPFGFSPSAALPFFLCPSAVPFYFSCNLPSFSSERTSWNLVQMLRRGEEDALAANGTQTRVRKEGRSYGRVEMERAIKRRHSRQIWALLPETEDDGGSELSLFIAIKSFSRLFALLVSLPPLTEPKQSFTPGKTLPGRRNLSLRYR